jgi:hypothetical protein
MSGSWLNELTPSQNELRKRLLEYSYSQEGEELEEYTLDSFDVRMKPIAKIFSKSRIGAVINAFDYLSDIKYYPNESSFWKYINDQKVTPYIFAIDDLGRRYMPRSIFSIDDEIETIAENMIEFMFDDDIDKRIMITPLRNLPSIFPSQTLIKPTRE